MASRVGRLVLYFFLVIVAIVTVFPMFWVILSSVKPPEDFTSSSPVPHRLTLANFVDAFGQSDLPTWIANTAIIAVLTTALGLLVCSLAAFAFARYDFAGKKVLFGAVIVTLAVPSYVTLIPVFIIERQLHLLNTYPAVVLPLAASVLALFLLRQYFSQLPVEIFDALRIDGASEWSAYWRIAVPLIRPGLAASGLLLFLESWNAYLLPLIVLRSPDKFNLSVGLSAIHSQLTQGQTGVSPWAVISVGAMVSIVPLAVCLTVMQRFFVAGLTRGAVR
jgi:ABC-type glycerol-3-phosphate transport system permease component